MLKYIDRVLSPELPKLLCRTGHGAEIVPADVNFTAGSLAGGKPVLRLPGVGMREACAAVLSVLPLDGVVRQPVAHMQVGDSAADHHSALQRAAISDLVAPGDARAEQCEATERFRFYERVRGAYAILQTGEMQAWVNLLVKKGVIAAELRP